MKKRSIILVFLPLFIIALLSSPFHANNNIVPLSNPLGKSSHGQTSPAKVYLPLVSKAGISTSSEQPQVSLTDLPPLTCITGILLLVMIPITILKRIRNSLRESIQ